MELVHIKGNTYAADTNGLMIPFYKVNERDIVLLDTGYAHPQREEFEELFAKYNLKPVGILPSHCHRDHTGSVRYFKEKYGCKVATSRYEAAVGSDVYLCRAVYAAMTPNECLELESFLFETDEIIEPGTEKFCFLGVEFGILELRGHTPGQIGVVTPDGVAYLADALMGDELMQSAKLPTMDDYQLDTETKKYLKTLHYEAYILAHKGVYSDISELIERNIAFLKQRMNFLIDCLEGEMNFDEWLENFYKKSGLRSNRPLRIGVLNRNFRSFVVHLADTEMVEHWHENGINHYKRK